MTATIITDRSIQILLRRLWEDIPFDLGLINRERLRDGTVTVNIEAFSWGPDGPNPYPLTQLVDGAIADGHVIICDGWEGNNGIIAQIDRFLVQKGAISEGEFMNVSKADRWDFAERIGVRIE